MNKLSNPFLSLLLKFHVKLKTTKTSQTLQIVFSLALETPAITAIAGGRSIGVPLLRAPSSRVKRSTDETIQKFNGSGDLGWVGEGRLARHATGFFA